MSSTRGRPISCQLSLAKNAMTQQQPLEIDFDTIEQYLCKFGEGEVILSKKYYDRGLGVIYLNNIMKKNAMSGRMMVKMRHCIQELENWNEGKCVLLCGVGGNFCSGGDLDFARASGTPKEALYMSTWMQDVLKRLQRLPMLTVCLIQGPTLGGGAEISIYCDLIVAADNVKFGFVHGKMGIITAWGGSTRLVQKVGSKIALDLTLTSEILNAECCVRRGIADHVVPTAEAFRKTLEWLDRRIQHHTTVIRGFKQVIQKATIDLYENAMTFEKELFCSTWGAEPNRQALARNIKHIKPDSGSKM